MSDKQQREQATVSAVGGWVNKDLAAAQAFTEQLPQGNVRQQAQSAIVWKTAEIDPEKALAMLEKTPSLERRGHYTSEIFSMWADHDPTAAAQGAAGLPGGQKRTNALEVVAQR